MKPEMNDRAMSEGLQKSSSRSNDLAQTVGDGNARDIVTIGLRMILSSVPVVGGPILELIGGVMTLRQERRITSLLEDLSQRLEEVEGKREDWKKKLSESEPYADLLLESMQKAVKTSSKDRHKRIATLLSNSVNAATFEIEENRQLLSLLGELTDLDLLVLWYNSLSAAVNRPERGEFRATYQAVNFDHKDHPEDPDSSPMISTSRNYIRLERLGLLSAQYGSQDVEIEGEIEIPDTSDPRGVWRYQISPIGARLVAAIDLPQSPPFGSSIDVDPS